MEKFVIGLALGSVVGALLVANNQKMRMLVKKAQDEAQEKIDAFMEEKIDQMNNAVDRVQEEGAAVLSRKKRK